MTRQRISLFGEYSGFAGPGFDGFVRESRYVPNREGIRLAVDVFRPTRDGVLSAGPLPTILTMTPYNRTQFVNSELVHALSPFVSDDGIKRTNHMLELSRSGYAIVVADVRGPQISVEAA